MGIALYVICHFSLVVLNIVSLSLIFVSLATMCLGVFFLGFILPGTLYASWTWLTISFPMLGKFSAIMFCNCWSLYELKYYACKDQSLENVYFMPWATSFYTTGRASISKHRQHSTHVKGVDSIWSQGCCSLLQYLCKGREETLMCPKNKNRILESLVETVFSPVKYLRFNPKYPADTSGKEPSCQCRRRERRRFSPWVGQIHWRRKWQSTAGFLPGESHGQKNWAGHSP